MQKDEIADLIREALGSMSEEERRSRKSVPGVSSSWTVKNQVGIITHNCALKCKFLSGELLLSCNPALWPKTGCETVKEKARRPH